MPSFNLMVIEFKYNNMPGHEYKISLIFDIYAIHDDDNDDDPHDGDGSDIKIYANKPKIGQMIPLTYTYGNVK